MSGTTLVSGVAIPKRGDHDPGIFAIAAVELNGAEFEVGVGRKDYEASDLRYQTQAYGDSAEPHFRGIGMPVSLEKLGALQQFFDLRVCFWCSAACTQVQYPDFLYYSTIDFQNSRQTGLVHMCFIV